MVSENGKNNKEGLTSSKRTLLIIGGVILLLVLAMGTYVLAFFSQVQETQRVLLDDVVFEEEFDVGEVFPDHIVNIALLGFDRGWNREALGEYLFRPDMLAVMSLNLDEDTIAVVRIPRDSYVPIFEKGGFHDKINHSYYFGYRSGNSDDPHADGIRSTLQTVSNVLGGIPIHYYVSVDMYSIIELVDAMGGIYYESEQEIIDKHWEVGRVLVPKGPQMMDGKTYLRYLQYRDNETNQDYGRIDRQMNLLKETFIYLRQQGKITDIPTTYRIYKDYVETDLTYKQIAALAYYARDFDIEGENLKFFTIQGDGQMKDGIWYQVLFQNHRVQIIKDVFGIDAQPWPPIILVDSPEYLEEQERKRREEELGIVDDQLGALPGAEENEDGENSLEIIFQQPVLIPDMHGMTVDEARTLLEEKGFILGDIIERTYNLVEADLVIYSQPLPGIPMAPGSVINLVVSTGPDS
ncbi:MAG: LCP family protein [Firmicutes bacterium]|nr:LCP family protein [Bacillota bacterium]